MNQAQQQAWAANWANHAPADLKLYIASVLIAIALIWAVAIIRRLGQDAMVDADGTGVWNLIFYAVRVGLLLIILVWFVS
ncbi:hypothetical protein [Nitrogeniibacter aestuarii]|uniref:hypothetical protein n=1 Tax=Nitrogeniibacter aestuarii TaxID=2815343 RepID=UPI001E63FAE3|nr:hypothetical protein [Nitrogeniibacter aestuarii]